VRHLARRLGAELSAAARSGDPAIHGVTSDSAAVRPGWLFCAVRGAEHDGHDFIDEAVGRGAAAVLVERWMPRDVPQLKVGFTRPLVGIAAAHVLGEPSTALRLAAVTGTNGKTTTTHLAWSALRGGHRRAGVIGTLGTRYGRVVVPGSMTTPPAWALQHTLADMVTAGMDFAVMEASSQGLDQDRLAGTRVEVATWLNLTPEHLDYHGTLEQYYSSKARLFDPALAARGLICIDDAWGRRLAAQARIPVTTFGTSADADVTIELLGTDCTATSVRLHGPDGDVVLAAPVAGRVNLTNIAAAYLIARALDVPRVEAVAGIAAAEPLPGRTQQLQLGQPFFVIVDYAHTPDALGALIELARSLTYSGGRVRLVLGCRGGKDRFKRPEMGRIAAIADAPVFTSDSPGREDPDEIVAQMLVGTIGAAHDHIRVERDRRGAIEQAIESAGPGDVVLISGRGHEATRVVGGAAEHFDDAAVARDALTRMGYDGLRRAASE
jgi:UDP-N-acetylmuramoyl-L-alanyl-D-glutamate--2,6-diaminopimelate ligase